MVRKATVYLESQVQSIKRPYTMAITAYALAKAKSHMRFFADVRLKQMSTLDRGKMETLKSRSLIDKFIYLFHCIYCITGIFKGS